MNSYKRIPLSQGKVALVDVVDYDKVAHHKWHVCHDPKSGVDYAVRNVTLPSGRQTTVKMHRVLLGLERGNLLEGEHKNRNGLDNRRSTNLRTVTHQQNTANQKLYANNTTGFKGVYAWKGRFGAHIRVDGRLVFLGYYATPKEASRRYEKAAKLYRGKFMRLR
jgi:hypothetical protein